MKKIFLICAIAVTFAYCNPSQQTDQTTTDSSRLATDTMSTGTGMPQ
ncbi:MAG: hypothetical protein JWQ96_1915 [Segetibacter sp.]|nr:hypothetical protein [Segetibacter sp.]